MSWMMDWHWHRMGNGLGRICLEDSFVYFSPNRFLFIMGGDITP